MTADSAPAAAALPEGARAVLRAVLAESFSGLYGLELLELSVGRVVAAVVVRDELKQPSGSLHGGVLAALAEDVASLVTGAIVSAEGGKRVVCLGNSLSFRRPVSEGRVEAKALVRRRGSGAWIWEVRMRDEAGRLCASAVVTVAIHDAGEGASGDPAVSGDERGEGGTEG